MARPKVQRKNEPPKKRVRGIIIYEEASPPRSTRPKLSPTGGKGKDKGKGPMKPSLVDSSSDIICIYDTHLTTLESDSEENSESRSPASESEPEDDQTLQRRQVELRSKALHDPARLLVTPHPPPNPTQAIEQAPPVCRYMHLRLV
uniref:Integrase core domain containing protein n=1 Tax=Solanum tuberosum TaxID=4113 RepID=M1DFH0_SOLTU